MIYTIDNIDQLKASIGEDTGIVSLVPSLTELLFDLGLDKQVTGITKFCIHPEKWFRTKTRVGGTKNAAIEKILALKPGLIIANKEENVKEQIELLSKDVDVLLTDINTITEALTSIQAIGGLLGRKEEADRIVAAFNAAVIKYPANNFDTIDVCYLIWQHPWMTVGGDTYINDTLAFGGFRNVFAGENRYPVIEEDAFIALVKSGEPVFLLSSEPYPFRQKHIDAIQSYHPTAKVVLVDGEVFSWYGSKLLKLPSYISELRKSIQ